MGFNSGFKGLIRFEHDWWSLYVFSRACSNFYGESMFLFE